MPCGKYVCGGLCDKNVFSNPPICNSLPLKDNCNIYFVELRIINITEDYCYSFVYNIVYNCTG